MESLLMGNILRWFLLEIFKGEIIIRRFFATLKQLCIISFLEKLRNFQSFFFNFTRFFVKFSRLLPLGRHIEIAEI